MNTRPVLVFVHGMWGFDRLGLGPLAIEYFRGVRACLADLPVDCHFPRLQAGSTVSARAYRLAASLDTLGSRSCCLVAHSRGGLDARYMASRLDSTCRIKQVITIGTPHHGTPLADWALRHGRALLRPLAEELSTAACRQFNEAIRDREDVVYTSYAGCRPQAEMPLWYRPWSRLIARAAGENDGQVPVSSACWGTDCHVVRADHLELIGWQLGRANPAIARPFDHLRLYRGIAERIVDSFDGA